VREFTLLVQRTAIAVIREFARFLIKYARTRPLTVSILERTPPSVLQIVIFGALSVVALAVTASRHFVRFQYLHHHLLPLQPSLLRVSASPSALAVRRRLSSR